MGNQMNRGVAASVGALVLAAGSPAAAESVVNISGVISSGIDSSGLFGTPGSSLVGKSFVVRVVMHDEGVFGDYEPGSSSALMSQRASIHYAINGVGYGISAPEDFGAFFARSDSGWGTYSSYTITSGAAFGGNSAGVSSNIYSPVAGLIPWDIWSSYDFTSGPGDAADFSGSVRRGGQSAKFTANDGPLRVWSGGTSAVPEPATWAMMIIGFGAVGSMVRTSRRRNAFSAA